MRWICFPSYGSFISSTTSLSSVIIFRPYSESEKHCFTLPKWPWEMQYRWQARRAWNITNHFRIGKYTSNTPLQVSARSVNGGSIGLIGTLLIINRISHLQCFFFTGLSVYNARFWCTSSCSKSLAIALDFLHGTFFFKRGMKHIQGNTRSYRTELFITRDFWTETCNLDSLNQ